MRFRDLKSKERILLDCCVVEDNVVVVVVVSEFVCFKVLINDGVGVCDEEEVWWLSDAVDSCFVDWCDAIVSLAGIVGEVVFAFSDGGGRG